MAAVPQTHTARQSTSGYEGGLARTLVRTLLIFTFIPLIVMAGAGYLRARSLLREQVVGQMQAQLQDQVARFGDSIKTKEIRLDRLAHATAREAQLAAALTSAAGVDRDALRQSIITEIRSTNTTSGRAVFSEFFLAANDGLIALASKPQWDDTQLHGAPYFSALIANDHSSFAI